MKKCSSQVVRAFSHSSKGTSTWACKNLMQTLEHGECSPRLNCFSLWSCLEIEGPVAHGPQAPCRMWTSNFRNVSQCCFWACLICRNRDHSVYKQGMFCYIGWLYTWLSKIRICLRMRGMTINTYAGKTKTNSQTQRTDQWLPEGKGVGECGWKGWRKSIICWWIITRLWGVITL